MQRHYKAACMDLPGKGVFNKWMETWKGKML